MGKYDILIGAAVLGVVGYFAYMMFAKKGGIDDLVSSVGRSIGGIQAGLGGYDDPYTFYEGNEDAWDPTSKRYKEITSRSSKKQKEDKKKQIDYIESYMANAYGI